MLLIVVILGTVHGMILDYENLVFNNNEIFKNNENNYLLTFIRIKTLIILNFD